MLTSVCDDASDPNLMCHSLNTNNWHESLLAPEKIYFWKILCQKNLPNKQEAVPTCFFSARPPINTIILLTKY